ncbi:hypothetical protein ACFFH4_09015 [Halalkalibacter alkalisediminis]|uniref:Uncharacterized protein n=1 Tax=Halalkalibacter alkalisediminis TaxID=935616 RepID=A0ABV6NFI7_9BACI
MKRSTLGSIQFKKSLVKEGDGNNMIKNKHQVAICKANEEIANKIEMIKIVLSA